MSDIDSGETDTNTEETKEEETKEKEELKEEKSDDGKEKDDFDIDDGSEKSKSLENAAPIAPLPPKVIQQEEGQIEVSASPAFQCLDELFQAGKLTGTKVALLKAKYTELHEALKNTRENETSLMRQAKDFANTMERQRSELEKADNFPESSNTEVSKLREQLLKYNNELAEAEEKQYQMEYKIECLTEEHKIMDREYSRLPKPGEIEKKVKEMQASGDEMRKEIHQRQLESKTLREELDSSQRQFGMDNKEFEKLMEQLENLKGELVQITTVPNQIAKEGDKISRQKNDVENKLRRLQSEHQDFSDSIKAFENKRQSVEMEKLDTEAELDKQRVILNAKEKEFDALMKDFEYTKEKEAVLIGDKAILDLNIRHIQLEKKSQHDIHSRKTREKDREIRNLKKSELHLKVAEETLNHSKSIHEKVKAQVDSLPKDDGTMMKKREELHKEVEHAKRELAQQNNLTTMEHVKLEASAQEEQDLLFEQSDLRVEVVELTRLAAIKADEREQKAREFMRAEVKYHKTVEDLKTKQLQLQDHQKKFQEMQVKLKDFAKLYDVIKNERNKCVNLIQTSTQKAAEMKEKIKILQNEIEILRTAVMLKDRQLQKQRLKHMNSIVIRDSLRNEVAKQQRIEEDMREKREQQKMDISKLNLMINQAEEEMVKLRKRYEKAVQHRNDRGIKLIERNEEVCIFYEKVNIQDQMVRNGNVELQAREEEIRFIKMQLNEENRAIELARKNMPNKRNLERELVTLQIQLQQCQDRMLELEKNLENPHDAKRVRNLEGQDLAPAELQDKIEELEMRLAEREEQLLEKDLIFEQTTRLANRVKSKAESGKDDTLQLAKTTNELQSKIKDSTRKMMAMVSELSMNQANALKMQHQVKDKESDLEQCYMRMEKGEPPSDEVEREWMRMLRDVDMRSMEREQRRMTEEEDEQYKLAGGITTTAEPRPNAYIPDDDCELPIPRPYGSHAPFKPTEAGSTMRHTRKPIPKPIEI